MLAAVNLDRGLHVHRVVSRWRGRFEQCEVCGLVYQDFRTCWVYGDYKSYRDVYSMLCVEGDDSSTWKYKRRGTVLGLWHQLKRAAWKEHKLHCEMIELARQEAQEPSLEEQLAQDRAELEELEDLDLAPDVYVEGVPF